MTHSLLTLTPHDLLSSLDLTPYLESGQVIHCQNQPFTLLPEEQLLFTPHLLDGSHKNISYQSTQHQLNGAKRIAPSTQALLKTLLHRYADYTTNWVNTLFPYYTNTLERGRTSYRPAEIQGRSSSKRKDDTRLHVDAFPSTPLQGKRILRVFNNIHPHDLPRVWELGEPFERVVKRFAHQAPPYRPWLASYLHHLHLTKSKRSAYDHTMLHIHNKMKLDEDYQRNVFKTRIAFAPNSLWFVFTDVVSHAALSGQFALEQTFYLPTEAMKNPTLSPAHHLNKTQGVSIKHTRF